MRYKITIEKEKEMEGPDNRYNFIEVYQQIVEGLNVSELVTIINRPIAAIIPPYSLKCDGNHGEPPCQDRGCWLKDPAGTPAEILAAHEPDDRPGVRRNHDR